MALGEWRRDEAKESQWREVLGKFTASGLSVRAFCARERVSEPSFYAWRRELALRDREQLAGGARNSRRSSPRRVSRKSTRDTSATRPRSAITPMPFLPVTLTAESLASQTTARSSASCIEVALPTGVLVRVPSGCDSATLHAVLTALRNYQEPSAC